MNTTTQMNQHRDVSIVVNITSVPMDSTLSRVVHLPLTTSIRALESVLPQDLLLVEITSAMTEQMENGELVTLVALHITNVSTERWYRVLLDHLVHLVSPYRMDSLPVDSLLEHASITQRLVCQDVAQE